MNHDTRFISDEATAAKFLQFLVERFTKRKMKLRFNTTLQGYGLELGDFLHLTHPLLPSTRWPETVNWEIYNLTLAPESGSIQVACVEV